MVIHPKLRASVLLFVTGTLGISCAEEFQGADPRDDGSSRELAAADLDGVREAIRSLGYSDAQLSFQDHYVVAEGHSIYHYDRLLEGEYTKPIDPTDRNDDKGYFSNPVSTANASNIGLVWSTINPPSAATKTAYLDAAFEWTNAPNSIIFIDYLNFGHAITVHEVATLPAGCVGQGCAEAPTSGKPGANAYMRTTPTGVPGCSSWNASWRKINAVHELGHAIGFEHPGTFTPIPGTCRTSPVNCSVSDYPTVMRASAILNSSCMPGYTTLRPDDLSSLDIKY